MIPIKDLRIGNWAIDSETGNTFQFGNGGFIDYFYFKSDPILITPKVIQWFSFEDLKTEYCESFKLKDLIIEFIPDGTINLRLCLGIGGFAYVISKDKYYLHELQNLFYSLYNEELQKIS